MKDGGNASGLIFMPYSRRLLSLGLACLGRSPAKSLRGPSDPSVKSPSFTRFTPDLLLVTVNDLFSQNTYRLNCLNSRQVYTVQFCISWEFYTIEYLSIQLR